MLNANQELNLFLYDPVRCQPVPMATNFFVNFPTKPIANTTATRSSFFASSYRPTPIASASI